MQATNHPQKGSMIRVDPIRSAEDIAKIRKNLSDNLRDSAIFNLGINTNLRASDIVALQVGQVKDLSIGDTITLREKKTQKTRSITINRPVFDSIQSYLATRPDALDTEPLFKSRKGGGPLCVPYLSGLVKSWCKDAKMKGNFGSHTLRKTFGYTHRTTHKTPLPILTEMFNHSTQRQTLQYLCIQPEEIRDTYLLEV